MAPRSRSASGVLRRPAAAPSQRGVARRSDSSSGGRSRLRASPIFTQVAVDTNELDYDVCPVLMNMKDGGLLTLDASLVRLKRKEHGGHHVYKLDLERKSELEFEGSGVHATIVRAVAIGWFSRTQFLQAASRLGSPASPLT